MNERATGRIDIDEVIALATQRAGVTDPEPDKFRANLELLIDAINGEDPVMAQMVAPTTSLMARAWSNRIQVDHWNRREPAIADEPIERPLAMVGLPRSGSTYFQYLFDQDPAMRMLRTWEGLQPCPPPALDPASVAPRIAALASAAQHGVATIPLGSAAQAAEFHAMHLTDLDGPQECVGIIDQTFSNIGNFWRHSIPGYFEAMVRTMDVDAAYAHHKRVLQTLQYGGPRRQWALKWPCHLMALDSLLRTYPDARLILTHRDPIRALASNCSLALFLRRGISPSPDPHAVGRDMLQVFRHFIAEVMHYERRGAGAPMVHVDYYRLVDAPKAVLAEAFAELGMEFTPVARDSVDQWRQHNPQGKRGRHSYQLADFGLHEDQLAEEFADYILRFDIRREAD